MIPELKKSFRYLHLFREDIREELDLLGLPGNVRKVCDFGCGSGLNTFALALDIEKSNCIGIDLFEEGKSFSKPNYLTENIQQACDDQQSPEHFFEYDLCILHHERRLPKFVQGNIVLNQNMPGNLDLACCKKTIV